MPKSSKPGPVKPGQPAPQSGQYGRVGPRGGSRGPEEVTLVKDKTVPPTPKPGEQYVLKDPTKHKSK